MKRKKILILADAPGWVVDKFTDIMISRMDFDFTKRFYTQISSEEFMEISPNFDLIHYQNWDIQYHLDVLKSIKTPKLVSVRSHRYNDIFENNYGIFENVHVINPVLVKEFPGSTFIPDGVDVDLFKPKHKFIVGGVGKKVDYNNECKGLYLIKQACDELGIEFRPAEGQFKYEEMPEYYNSIDVLVCASSRIEGQFAAIFECMAMNKPVITVDINSVLDLNLVKVDRSVEGIKEGILKFYNRPLIEKQYSWEVVCENFTDLYNDTMIQTECINDRIGLLKKIFRKRSRG
ncbi:glycosyltransferase [Candidatus Dojkabacteria bacterium]|nr:glycosyltransferase [Candidatus Dojkabacteria bacterium]